MLSDSGSYPEPVYAILLHHLTKGSDGECLKSLIQNQQMQVLPLGKRH